ncbi:MAG: Hsp33 family molecular chaperone HslO [Tissierellia bacterium]|nr:Hsp33 family molecular chaperone HslO [Tissierellia bacterium]
MADYLIRAIDKDMKLKITTAVTTELVSVASKAHETSATASAALGRALTATTMMSTNLKNDQDIMTMIIDGGGTIGKIVTVANNKGEVKGYVSNPTADAPSKHEGKLDVGAIVGRNGSVQVIMDLGLKEPYVGQAPLISGEIAEDIANFFYISDQINSAVGLGVLVDVDLSIIAAGGFIIQLLPGVEEADIVRLEETLSKITSVTQMITDNLTPEDMLNELLPGYELDILEKTELEFKCNCSKEKIKDLILSLGREEIENMIEEDKGAEVVCQFCNTAYQFNEDELREILETIVDDEEK